VFRRREWPASETKAHSVFEEMLLIKRPDVILSLQCVTKFELCHLQKSLWEHGERKGVLDEWGGSGFV
jgi:hypothetical protein